MNKALVRKHFDRHAGDYDRFAIVQAEMAEQVAGRIPLRDYADILEIGCGTGLLTTRLTRRFPLAHYTALDLSENMLHMTQAKVPFHAGGLRLIAADAEELAGRADGCAVPSEGEQSDYVERTVDGIVLPHRAQSDCGEPLADSFCRTAQAAADRTFDLIVSGAAFQWFELPLSTARAYRERFLRPGGCMAISTFGPRTFHELHESFRAAEAQLGLPARRHGQTFAAAAEWRSAFAAKGGRLILQEADYVAHYPSVREFLHSVRRMGAGHAGGEDEAPAGLGKRLLAEMEAHYRQNYGGTAGIAATFHLVYLLYLQDA